jgi:lysophospholipase L1-like esterase
LLPNSCPVDEALGAGTVPVVRKRLLIVVILGCVWAPLAWWVQSSDVVQQVERNEQVDQVNETLESSGAEWVREDLFYRVLHNVRTPHDKRPLQRPQFGERTYANPDRIRVLALGDSYGEGYGLTDSSVRWGERLEDEIDALTAPGASEVVVLAASGASSFTYAQWIEAVAARDQAGLNLSDEEMASLGEPFDVIVVTHIANDVIAYGDDVVPGGPDSFIPVSEWSDVVSGKIDNPHWDAYQDVPARMAAAAQGAALVWHPVMGLAEPLSDVERLFRDAGFAVADAPAVVELMSRRSYAELMVHPQDHHPNPELHVAFATDLAAAVLDQLSSGRVEAATASAVPAQYPLVSNVLPTNVDVTTRATGTSTTIAVSSPNQLTARWCGMQNTSRGELRCSADGEPEYAVDGERVGALHSLCVPLDRPYIQVMLDRHLDDGTSVAVRNTGTVTLVPYSFGYDELWVVAIMPLAEGLEPGQEMTFTTSRERRGVLFGVEGRTGCPLDADAVISLPELAAELVVVP